MENHIDPHLYRIFESYSAPSQANTLPPTTARTMMNHPYPQHTEVPSAGQTSNSPVAASQPNILQNPNHQGHAPSILPPQYYHAALQTTASRPPPIMYMPSSSSTHSPAAPSTSPTRSSQQYTHPGMSDPVRADESTSFLEPQSDSPFPMSVFQSRGSHLGSITTETNPGMDLRILSAEQYPHMAYSPDAEAMKTHAAPNITQVTVPGKGGKDSSRKRRGVSDDLEGKQLTARGTISSRRNAQDNTKQRGRPRLDTKDENAADRRRTQIRLAQRAYRERKETTISTLRDRVTKLESSMDEIESAFLELHDAAYAVVSHKNPEPSEDPIQNLALVLPSARERFVSLIEANKARVRSGGHGGSSGDEENGDATGDENTGNHDGSRRKQNSAAAVSLGSSRTSASTSTTSRSDIRAGLNYNPPFESYSSKTVVPGADTISPLVKTTGPSLASVAKSSTTTTTITATATATTATSTSVGAFHGTTPSSGTSITSSGPRSSAFSAAAALNTITGFGQTFSCQDPFHQTQDNTKNNTVMFPQESDKVAADCNPDFNRTNSRSLKRKKDDSRYDSTDTNSYYNNSLTPHCRSQVRLKGQFGLGASVFPSGDWSSVSGLSQPFLASLPSMSSPSPYDELSMPLMPDPIVPHPHRHDSPYPRKEGFTRPDPAVLTYDLFDADSFSARLHRACIERAYVLLTAPDVDRDELARVFIYTFRYVTKKQAARAVKQLLMKMDANQLREKVGQKRRKVGRRMSNEYQEEEGNEFSWCGDGYKLITGLDMNEYLRPEEVEQYCIDIGVFSGPTGNGHYTFASQAGNSYHGSICGETSSGTSDSGISRGSSHSPPPTSPEQMWPHDSFQLAQGQVAYVASSPGQPNNHDYISSVGSSPVISQRSGGGPFRSTVDMDRFIQELIHIGICLGRSPGFKRKDVDQAIKLSTIPSARQSPLTYVIPSPVSSLPDGNGHRYDTRTRTPVKMEEIEESIQGNAVMQVAGGMSVY